MNRNQFFSIFIAVIMLGSTIGFALVSMQNNPDTPNNNGDEPPVQPPTEIRFVAPGVESEIVELLPSIRILGTTENLNINDLDSQIYNISGVRNVASKFSNETGQITYVATVSF
ncbi:MAG: hypothetical protein JW772_02840, partial [Candidatus Diapherotrites archaeon]|nr:hypothetical protein [Candidatus Diapherotrites archaeon]